MAISTAKLRDPRFMIALGFGSGLAPRAPGTFGTLAAIPFYLGLSLLDPVIYLVVVAMAFLFGVWVCDVVAEQLGLADPGAIVWDEFVGLWIALFLLPEPWWWLVIGFALFRAFDILKPWPVSYCDQHFKGGFGIMIDDVAAGLYALISVQLLAQAVQHWPL